MTPERYGQVARVYHAALELPGEQRPEFLAAACGGDAALRLEVESLLAAHGAAGDFMATPAITMVARSMAAEEPAGTVGRRAGAYEILAPIGRGGMGEVYEARDTRLGRRVAVKLLRRALTTSLEAVRRFEQEARAASSLNHPNIVTIHEIGDVDGRRFLAMELVEGQSLAALDTPLGVDTVARVGAQLAKALSVAHAAGIVHRDIKPENIMLRADGYVKLLDFGLARLAPQPSAEATATQGRMILGTPRYMSPEQARGEVVTSASDVFSLGLVLYELATGAHPFASRPGRAVSAIRSMASPTQAPRPPAAPPPLEGLLRRMLETHPDARPSAGEIADELTRLAVATSQTLELAILTARHQLPNHNLPPQRMPLVGRTIELADVKGRLLDSSARLLTLTGPGGTGKTRLAIHVAADLAPLLEGGVSFVDLAPISDPNLAAATVARALRVSDAGDRPLVAMLCAHLNDRGRTLLLLDNFEQVSGAATIVRELLDGCPALSVLVTSRVALRIYGEQEFPISPLPLPSDDAPATPAALLECASIALFVQRAAAVRPDFTLTASNAPAVVEICRRLDGLPLAIELAAARVKVLPPAELLGRLELRLELLTGGARDLPERHQTLRRTISWSYDLLMPAEQKLFRRLSVFVGGCTLEAAEAVCNTREDLGVDILHGVASLVDNSLLVQPVSNESPPRFFMLETFREYAQEQLLRSGERDETSRAHAAYMLVLAEEAPIELNPPEREPWLCACDAEHDNARAAFTYLIGSRHVEWALRLAAALFRFWEQREHVTEGRETLARVLAMPGAEEPTRMRARALYGASVLADVQGDLASAQAHSRAARDIYQQFDDTRGVATITTAMAWQAQHGGNYAEATALHAETVELWRSLGDITAIDLALSNTANAAKAQGDFTRARGLLHDLLASSQARRDLRAMADALNGLGDLAAAQADPDGARHYHRQSLAAFRQIDDRWGIARVLTDLANLELQKGDDAAAPVALLEALGIYRELGHQRGVARLLELLSYCAGRQRRDAAAVRLLGAAAAIRQRIGAPVRQAERDKVNETVAQITARMHPDAFGAAWKEGRMTPLDAIVHEERRTN